MIIGLNTGLENSLDQLDRSNSEGMSQLHDIDETQISFTTFDSTHIVALEIRGSLLILYRG
jgi:hypothetical protein